MGVANLSSVCAFIHVNMFCHRNATLFPMVENISSGMGISRTVSNPSSLLMFGQSLLRDDFAAGCFISVCVLVSVYVLFSGCWIERKRDRAGYEEKLIEKR